MGLHCLCETVSLSTVLIACIHASNYNVHTQDGSSVSSLPVKQFQFMSWPEGVPEASLGLIDLIGQVQKWQMNSGNKPIVVQCRY